MKLQTANDNDDRLSYLLKYEEMEKHKNKNLKSKAILGKDKEYILSNKMRWFLFAVFIILQILMNVDHGTLPAAVVNIREDLHIKDDTIGVFGSFVFLGNLIGSSISFWFINRYNRKYLLLISLALNSLCLWSFTLTDVIALLFLNRIVVGIFQAFISIYVPVWCDQYGFVNKKAIMLSFIQAGSPLGVVFGYYLTYLIKDIGWKYSFVVQAISVALTALILLFIPPIYFSSTLIQKIKCLTYLKSNPNDKLNEEDVISVFQETNSLFGSRHNSNNDREEFRNDGSASICRNLFKILNQKVFVFCSLSLSCLFFIITAVQYWATDYMSNNFEDGESMRILSFSVVCITSPTFGVIIGGWLSSLIGGYESKNCSILCLIFGILSGLCCIPVPFLDNLLNFTIFLWLVLFFGACIVPPMMGIIITSLPHHLRGSTNSITYFICNALGYLPAPFVYGIINEKFSYINPRIAFSCVMYYSWLGVLFLAIATYFKHKEFRKKSEISSMPIDGKKSEQTIISNNLGKVFGTCVNIDHDLILQNEDKKPGNPKINKNDKINNKTKLNVNSIGECSKIENEYTGDEHEKDEEIVHVCPSPALNINNENTNNSYFDLLNNETPNINNLRKENENHNNIFNSKNEENNFNPQIEETREIKNEIIASLEIHLTSQADNKNEHSSKIEGKNE